MTSAQSILPPSPVVSPLEQRLPRIIVIRWSSQSGPASADQRTFVLQLDIERGQHAQAAAWIEHGAVRQIVLERTLCTMAICGDHNLTHLDVFAEDGSRRIAALSFKEMTAEGVRPLYARTALLATAGFAAGAYDPPTLVIAAHHRNET